MRKWMMVGLVAIALATAGPAAAQDGGTPTPTPQSGPVDVTAACQSAVEGMAALTGDLRVPDHLQVENPGKNADDFDVSHYFSVLDRLAVEDGYRLDYVYQYDFMGGYPILYTQPEDETPHWNVPAYAEAISPDNPDAAQFPDYLERIVVEDTPEGYMQMVALDVMGSQFYLFWHAGYNDWQIICNEGMLETLLESDDLGFGQPIDDEVAAQARELDVTPTVEIGKDAVRVEVILFTKWGGFARVTYTVDRAYPRAVYESDGEVLVEYDCGVMF